MFVESDHLCLCIANSAVRTLHALQQVDVNLSSANRLQHLTSKVVRDWFKRSVIVAIQLIEGNAEEVAADLSSITACSHESRAAELSSHSHQAVPRRCYSCAIPTTYHQVFGLTECLRMMAQMSHLL